MCDWYNLILIDLSFYLLKGAFVTRLCEQTLFEQSVGSSHDDLMMDEVDKPLVLPSITGDRRVSLRNSLSVRMFDLPQGCFYERMKMKSNRAEASKDPPNYMDFLRRHTINMAPRWSSG